VLPIHYNTIFCGKRGNEVIGVILTGGGLASFRGAVCKKFWEGVWGTTVVPRKRPRFMRGRIKELECAPAGTPRSSKYWAERCRCGRSGNSSVQIATGHLQTVVTGVGIPRGFDGGGFLFPGGNRGGVMTLTFLSNIPTVELHIFRVFCNFLPDAGTELNKN
jgi:hypothetical protein